MPVADSISMRVMLETVDRINALNLAGVPPENVMIHKRPTTSKKDLPASTPLPCIIVAPTPEEAPPNGGTNVRDDIGYKYRILMIAVNPTLSQTLNFDRILYWREQIRQKLNNHRFEGIPETMRAIIQAGPVIDPSVFDEGLDLSGLLMTITSRETRIA